MDQLWSEPLPLEPGKRCSRCGEWKFLTEFNRFRRNPDGRQPMCRECHKAYHYANWDRHMAQIRRRSKRVRRENRRRIYEYLLEHACVDCGEDDPVVLEFDHLRDKKWNVATMGSLSWATTLSEIEKCEVACANCHRRRTAERANSYRFRRSRGVVGVAGVGPASTD